MDINGILNKIGVESESMISLIRVVAMFIIVGLIAWLVVVIAKRWLPKLIGRLTLRTKAKWDDYLFDQKFFNSLGGLLVPIVIYIGLSSLEWSGMATVNRLIWVCIVITGTVMLSALLDGITRVFENHASLKDKPIRVFIQIIKIFLWCAVVMVIVSIFSGKSLLVLLGGLTAFAAVLMLIFQDTILGFVAGMQLGSNRMIRVGDWIEMPNGGADGDVIEIGLTTVKVQNWDKTITTIPTHKLVAESFINWRGMQDSGGRRIKRSVNIDVNSIRYLSPEDFKELKNSRMLKDYIGKKIAELTEFNSNRESHLDERRLTNIGTFREYLEVWLANNPDINRDMTHMVRQLQPGPTGLPLEIYCFTATTAWISYENIQSDIFDHVFAIMPLFGLRAFQYSGTVISRDN